MDYINKDKMETNFLKNNFSFTIKMDGSLNRLFKMQDRGSVITRSIEFNTPSISQVYQRTQARIQQQTLSSEVMSRVIGFQFRSVIPMNVISSIVDLGNFIYKKGGRGRAIIITDNSDRIVARINAFTSFTSLYSQVNPSAQTLLDDYKSNNNYEGAFYVEVDREGQVLRSSRNQFYGDNEVYDCVIRAIVEREYGKGFKEYATMYDVRNRHTYLKSLKKSKTEAQQKEFDGLKKRMSALNKFDKIIKVYTELTRKQKGLTERQVEQLATEVKYSIHFKSLVDKKDTTFIANGRSDTTLVLYNTRLDHLDKVDKCMRLHDYEKWHNQLNTTPIETYEEMETIIKTKDIDRYWRDSKGISTIYDRDNNVYKIHSRAREIHSNFTKDNNINDYWWYIKNNDVEQNFADNMNGVAGCVDFKDLESYRQLEQKSKHLILVDRTKSYYNYDKLPNYNGGVAGKLLQPPSALPPPSSKKYSRQVKDLKDMATTKHYVGFFAINNIQFNHSKAKQINDKLKLFRNGCIYLGETLKLLDDLHTTYTITHYSLFTREELRFTEDMQSRYSDNPNDIKEPPIYAKVIGRMMTVKEEESYYMKGDEIWASHLQSQYEDYNHPTKISYYNDELKVKTRLKKRKTLVQIPATITHLQHICVFNQLLELNPDKIIRVVGDGIYFLPHSYKLLKSHGFREEIEEKKFKLNNVCGHVFTSQMPIRWTDFANYDKETPYGNSYIVKNRTSEFDLDIEYRPQDYPINIPTPYKEVELWLGAGGCGKTYHLFKEYLPQNNIGPDEFLYLCPTHSLKTELQNEYNDYITSHSQVNTRHKITAETCDQRNEQEVKKFEDTYKHLLRGKNVLIIDELTMCPAPFLYKIIEKYSKKFRVIIIGDCDFHKKRMYSYQISDDNYDKLLDYIPRSNIRYFKNDRRARDNELKLLKKNIRSMISNKEKQRPNLDIFEKRYFHIPSIKKILQQSGIRRIRREDINKVFNTNGGDRIISSHNYLDPHPVKDIKTGEYKQPIEDRKNKFQKLINQPYKRWVINKNGRKSELVSKTQPPYGRECYSTSAHSIQGHTIENSKVFIDYTGEFCIFSLQHLYVAISRVRNFNQLCIII